MLNWVAVLRRILKLYGVHSAQELGMALGVPIRLGEDGPGGGGEIPWEVLEIVVTDKGVSWDWVLTGRDFCRPDDNKEASKTGIYGDDRPIVRKQTKKQTRRKDNNKEAALSGDKPPRLETRELARTLLGGEALAPEDPGSRDGAGGWIDVPAPAAEVNAKRDEEVVRELESIKASMQRELSRVESILKERKK